MLTDAHVSLLLGRCRAMFYNTPFNADISKWSTGNVDSMNSVFKDASSFNADISKWDMGKAIYYNEAFDGATLFNGDVSKWDVSKGTSFKQVAHGSSGRASY